MSNIVKVYKESIPPLAFVGRKYHDAERQNGGFGHLWTQWFQENRFAPLRALIDPSFREAYIEADALIGLMREQPGEPFEYWIGMFVPTNARCPEGYETVTLPVAPLGIGWVEGGWNDVFCQEEQVYHRLEANGISPIRDEQGALFFFERYAESRFQGHQPTFILDIGFFVKS
jgi:hypothetical protein